MKMESQLREKLNHSLKTLHWKYRRKVTANNFNFLKVPAAVFIETNILCQQRPHLYSLMKLLQN